MERAYLLLHRCACLAALIVFTSIGVVVDAADASRAKPEKSARGDAPTHEGGRNTNASNAWMADEARAPSPVVERTADLVISHGARLAQNFRVLLGRSWDESFACAKSVILHAVGWSVAGGILGLVIAVFGYWWLKKQGWLDVPWRGWRFFRWLWCVLFIASLSGGLSYAGFWHGGARNARYWIEERHLLDGLVLNFHAAIMLDSVNYQATGAETVEGYHKLLSDGAVVNQLVDADYRQAMKAITDHLPEGFPARVWVARQMNETIGQWMDGVTGLDSRKILVILMDHPNLAEYVRDHPGADPSVLALSTGLKSIRVATVGWINSMAWPNVGLGLLFAVVPPLGALALFHITLWVARRCVRWWRARRESKSPA